MSNYKSRLYWVSVFLNIDENKNGFIVIRILPSEKVDAFALTYYQGGLVLTNQNINLGIFTGFDAMLDKQNDWFYQGKQWFSLGIGYKFNKD